MKKGSIMKKGAIVCALALSGCATGIVGGGDVRTKDEADSVEEVDSADTCVSAYEACTAAGDSALDCEESLRSCLDDRAPEDDGSVPDDCVAAFEDCLVRDAGEDCESMLTDCVGGRPDCEWADECLADDSRWRDLDCAALIRECYGDEGATDLGSAESAACYREHEACIDAADDDADCDARLEECLGGVVPIGPPPELEEECRRVYEECLEGGRDDCEYHYRTCLGETDPIVLDEEIEACLDDHESCIESGELPDSCDARLLECIDDAGGEPPPIPDDADDEDRAER